MRLPEFIRNSLFKKLMFLMLLVAAVPIGSSLLYFFYVARGETQQSLPWLYYGMLLLTVVIAVVGAYFFSLKISRPITHFIQSARKIAGGDFSLKVKVESSDEIGRLARIFNYMTEELRRLHQRKLGEIINERYKTKAILRNIADGVIVTDPGHKILMINSVAEKWFDVSGESHEGQPFEEIIDDDNLVGFIKSISEHNGESPSSIEITLRPESARGELVLQARAAQIYGDENELIGVVTVLRDITREKEIDRMKTELVSMVAHELRSPLTCISGFSELLMDETITQEQAQEYASIILKESNRLNELINKFLDISKIEAGRMQVQKSPVDLKMLIEKVVDFNSQLAEKKAIQVSVEAPERISTIQVDRDMMEQVVLNLFSNAVKYSPEHARVTLRLHETEESMVIEVEDTGYGISEKALPHIFDKFYRITDNDQVADISGSGLGLSLVKRIVELHQGKVEVSSRLGEGSRFTVTLPKFQEVPSPEAMEELLV